MKKSIRNIAKGLIKFIKNLINTIISLFQMLRFLSLKCSLDKYSVYNGKPLVVMGNGPSLNDNINNHYSILSQCDICVVNDFGLSEKYELIRPNYYFFVDDMYWLEKEKTIVKAIDNRNKLFDKLNNVTNWPMVVFVPSAIFKLKYFQHIFLKNDKIKILPLNRYPYSGFDSIKYFLYRNNLSMPQVQNVLVAAIFIGLNLEYKKIFLIGTENDWTKYICVNSHNQVCVVSNHFYETEQNQLTPFLKGTGEIYKLSEILSDLSKTFTGYLELEKYSKVKRANIYNCCNNSFIDAFERCEFNNDILVSNNV